VSSFFLQQNVDSGDRAQIDDWLTRFKELDPRLVQWKRFLSDRWKQSNVSKDATVRMDPVSMRRSATGSISVTSLTLRSLNRRR